MIGVGTNFDRQTIELIDFRLFSEKSWPLAILGAVHKNSLSLLLAMLTSRTATAICAGQAITVKNRRCALAVPAWLPAFAPAVPAWLQY